MKGKGHAQMGRHCIPGNSTCPAWERPTGGSGKVSAAVPPPPGRGGCMEGRSAEWLREVSAGHEAGTWRHCSSSRLPAVSVLVANIWDTGLLVLFRSPLKAESQLA